MMKKTKRILLFAVAVGVLMTMGCSTGRSEQKIDKQPISQKDSIILAEKEKPKLSQPFRVVAYLPTSAEMPTAEALQMVTDIVLIGGIAWDENGSVVIADKGYETLIGEIKAVSNVRVWSTVFPKGSMIRNGTVGESIATVAQREKLAQSLCEHTAKYGLYGIDIDWEFPKDESEWNSFSQLIEVLSLKLQSNEKKLSLALYPKDISLSKSAIKAVDYVNIMAYDMFDKDGYHSTYQTAVNSVDYFTELGFDTKCIIMGIPLYGRPTDASNRWDLYNTIPTITDPEQNIYNGSYYNGLTLIKQKTEFAQKKNCAGVMLYHLGCDTAVNEKTSVLKAIYEITQQAK
ncbi:MAG: glycoside hydrolase family 18 protein [Oscillospiraceae bacterium]